MIIKTIGWKRGSFKRLVKYIGKEQGTERPLWAIHHNLNFSPDLEETTRQFEQNDQHRTKRKNGVRVYHIILSWSPQDRDKLTPEMMEDMAQHFIELRAPNALAFAAPHYDKGHPHVHLALSANEYKSRTSLRLDKKQFVKVRKDMERYQGERYPELKHSFAYDKEKTKERRRKRRAERTVKAIFDTAQGLHKLGKKRIGGKRKYKRTRTKRVPHVTPESWKASLSYDDRMLLARGEISIMSREEAARLRELKKDLRVLELRDQRWKKKNRGKDRGLER